MLPEPVLPEPMLPEPMLPLAPMPLDPVLPLEPMLPVPDVLEPIVPVPGVVAVLLRVPDAPLPDVPIVDWQPARAAASAMPATSAGRVKNCCAMFVPLCFNAKCACGWWQAAFRPYVGSALFQPPECVAHRGAAWVESHSPIRSAASSRVDGLPSPRKWWSSPG